MGTDELTNAIRGLAARPATEIAPSAFELANEILPVAAEYRTPIDVAALRILAIALYQTATETLSSRDVSALLAYVDVSLDEAFDAVLRNGARLPEPLAQFVHALSNLPDMLITTATKHVHEGLLRGIIGAKVQRST